MNQNAFRDLLAPKVIKENSKLIAEAAVAEEAKAKKDAKGNAKVSKALEDYSDEEADNIDNNNDKKKKQPLTDKDYALNRRLQKPSNKTALTDATTYRDRASERRKGISNTDVLGGDAYDDIGSNATSASMSEFLGGDEAHTHLVRGLDRAMAEKMRRIERGEEDTEKEREMEVGKEKEKEKEEVNDDDLDNALLRPERQRKITTAAPSTIPNHKNDAFLKNLKTNSNISQSVVEYLRGKISTVKAESLSAKADHQLRTTLAYDLNVGDGEKDNDNDNDNDNGDNDRKNFEPEETTMSKSEYAKTVERRKQKLFGGVVQDDDSIVYQIDPADPFGTNFLYCSNNSKGKGIGRKSILELLEEKLDGKQETTKERRKREKKWKGGGKEKEKEKKEENVKGSVFDLDDDFDMFGGAPLTSTSTSATKKNDKEKDKEKKKGVRFEVGVKVKTIVERGGIFEGLGGRGRGRGGDDSDDSDGEGGGSGGGKKNYVPLSFGTGGGGGGGGGEKMTRKEKREKKSVDNNNNINSDKVERDILGIGGMNYDNSGGAGKHKKRKFGGVGDLMKYDEEEGGYGEEMDCDFNNDVQERSDKEGGGGEGEGGKKKRRRNKKE